MTTIFASATAGMVGLLFFFLVFVGIAVWALTPGRKQQLESYKYLPLSENDHGRE